MLDQVDLARIEGRLGTWLLPAVIIEFNQNSKKYYLQPTQRSPSAQKELGSAASVRKWFA